MELRLQKGGKRIGSDTTGAKAYVEPRRSYVAATIRRENAVQSLPLSVKLIGRSSDRFDEYAGPACRTPSPD